MSSYHYLVEILHDDNAAKLASKEEMTDALISSPYLNYCLFVCGMHATSSHSV